MRILYLADIRFPLERANCIQSMESCHALATRGHHVTLVVRPDTQDPARDPFDFYALPRIENLEIEVAPATGHIWARPRHQLSKMNIELEWFEKYARRRTYTAEPVPAQNDPKVVPAP